MRTLASAAVSPRSDAMTALRSVAGASANGHTSKPAARACSVEVPRVARSTVTAGAADGVSERHQRAEMTGRAGRGEHHAHGYEDVRVR